MINFHDFKIYTDALYHADKAFDKAQTDRLARHRHLEPESAQFLAALIMTNDAQQVLEIGTSTGYSTLWIAYALAQINQQLGDTCARLTSIELDEWRLLTARNHLRTLSLDGCVSLQQVDAKDFLQAATARYDVIFLDAERKFYLAYVADFKRLMQVGDALIVDNVLSHADEVADFLAAFTQDDNFLCTTIPIGAGLFMAVRQS